MKRKLKPAMPSIYYALGHEKEHPASSNRLHVDVDDAVIHAAVAELA
jgi:hypothetical protein